MNIQDLTLEELKICSLLYSTANSVLFPLEVIVHKDIGIPQDIIQSIAKNLGIPNLKAEDIQMRTNNTIFEGQWHGKTRYTAPQIVIQSLTDKGLLLEQEEDSQKVYTLNKSEKLKEFFKELEVQIALGAIHYDSE